MSIGPIKHDSGTTNGSHLLTRNAPTGIGGGIAPKICGGGGIHSALFLSGGGAHYYGNGAYSDIVGDGANAVLEGDPNGHVLQNVVWTVAGPGPIIGSQTYSLKTGGNTYDKFPITDQTPNGQSDDFLFYWGAVPGQYTITATANYFDGSDTVSISVQVYAPTLNSLTMTQQPMAFGPFSNAAATTANGLHQGDTTKSPPTYGDVVQANVTMPADQNIPGGQFAFLQMINMYENVTNNITGNHVQNSNGFVLDDTGQSWFQMVWVSQYYLSQGQKVIVPVSPPQGKSPTVYDDPVIAQPAAWVGDPTKDYYTAIEAQNEFKTYLMFLPNQLGSEHVWVPVGVVAWNWQASTTYNATTKQYVWDNTIARDPPDTGATRNGVAYTGDISWTTNQHEIPWNPPY